MPAKGYRKQVSIKERRVTPKESEIILIQNMRLTEYMFEDLYLMYTEVLNRDALITLEPLRRSDFGKLLKKVVSIEKSWLCKRGAGKDAVYYKRIVGLSNLSLKELTESAKRLYQQGLEKCNWIK